MSGIGPMLVAVDDGYDTTKACTRERSDRFPTAVTAARKRTARLLGSDRMDDVSYLIGDQEFTVGADVQDPLDTRSDQYPYSPASLAVAMEAIRRVAPAPVKVHAITGSHLVRRILFVGGGSTELKAEILRRFPSACFPAGDPQMANARGMLKYGHVVREAQRSATAA